MNTLHCSDSDRARRYVEKIPGAVEGNHGDAQTLGVANALVWDFALSSSEALAILREYNARCSPPWTEAELIRKLQSAEKQPHSKPRGNLLDAARQSEWRTPAWPQRRAPIDQVTAIENYLNGFRCTAADLIAASTCKIPPLICGPHFHRQGAYLIDQLFEPGERVNIVSRPIVTDGKARPGDAGVTLERNEWEKRILSRDTPRHGDAWLRMNPVDGDGVADANVTAFRFGLLEIDKVRVSEELVPVPMELQLSLLAKLRLPIAAIILSGGKSAHAWVKLDAANADEYRQTVSAMLALLARFGVDGKNKNPSRLSRLPGVIRTVGASGDGCQRLLYLNPEPRQEAIL